MDNTKVIRWFLIIVLLVSLVSLIGVYFSGYVPEVHNAKALPLSIVVGLTAIAVSINQKKN